MDGTLKCCINVKFLKWKTAVFLCKGMSLFFKTHAVKIETKIYDVNNLLLNSKFIPISTDEIESAVGSLALHETTKEELIRQLKAAFKPKEICILEESYILNTLSKEMKLQLTEINDLLNILRLNSIESANNKLNVSAETRLYNAIKNQESQT